MVAVVTLLAYGCPIRAIVAAFSLDERTIARWQREKAGTNAGGASTRTRYPGRRGALGARSQADELRIPGSRRRRFVVGLGAFG